MAIKLYDNFLLVYGLALTSLFCKILSNIQHFVFGGDQSLVECSASHSIELLKYRL